MSHENRVHWNRMKNVTLSADDALIEQARLTARERHTTLNQAFRDWLVDYTRQSETEASFDALYERLSYVNTGRKFTRDEMNER